MNTFLLFTLVVLPALGALIAWLGDVIGYRLGKSRRTLFGLRPRVTARLIGVIVGAVLPLLGIGVAAVGSSQVRTALLHLNDLRERNVYLAGQNRSLTVDRTRLDADVTRLKGETQKARVTAKQAQDEAADAGRRAAKAQTRLAAVRRDLVSSRAALTLAEQRRAALQKQRDALQKRVDQLSAQASDLQTQLASADKQVKSLEKQREDAAQRLDDMTQKLNQADALRQEASADAEALRKDADRLQSDVADLQSQRTQLEGEVDKVNRHLAHAQSELVSRQQQLETAQRKLEQADVDYKARLKYWVGTFESQLAAEQAVEDSPIIFEPGQEIVRVEVSAQQTPAQLRAALAEVMVLANGAAKRAGVQPDSSGAALALVRPLPPGGVVGETFNQDDILRGVASRMLESGDDSYVVIVRSLERHFAAEQRLLRVEMWVTPDKVRFHEGEVIFTIRFDPGTPGAEVLRRILGIRPRLREIARDRGLLPDPQTGEYGVMRADQMLDALDELEKAKRPMELRVVVAGDVRTADPLAVNLEVRSARG